jgi:MerR family copper efflux transcriptional regulator
MNIGAIARAAGASRDTLRFYEKRGLIRSTRGDNGYRRYGPETAQLVVYIRTAQKLGFSLADIGANMAAVADASDPDAAVAALLASKVAVIDARIAELQLLKDELLARLRQQCPLAATAPHLDLPKHACRACPTAGTSWCVKCRVRVPHR